MEINTGNRLQIPISPGSELTPSKTVVIFSPLCRVSKLVPHGVLPGFQHLPSLGPGGYRQLDRFSQPRRESSVSPLGSFRGGFSYQDGLSLLPLWRPSPSYALRQPTQSV